MILISHRGNIDGARTEMENKPSYILQALQYGFDCEVDVWFKDGKFHLGHDKPQYEFPFELIKKYHNKLWLHCKDKHSLSKLNDMDSDGTKLNYFGHNVDQGVLTSKGYIWSVENYDNGILVMPEVFNTTPDDDTIGICSDEIVKYKK